MNPRTSREKPTTQPPTRTHWRATAALFLSLSAGAIRFVDNGRFTLNSLRTKLLLFAIVLVVAPGVIFALLAFSSTRSTLEDTIGRQLAEVAHDAATIVSTEIAGEQARLRTWAAQDLMREILIDDLDKRIARFLKSVGGSDPRYIALVCLNRAGIAVAATDAAWVGGVYETATWFAHALAGVEVLSGPRAWPGEPHRALELAVPIPHPDDPRDIIGVLLLLYDWSRSDSLFLRSQENLEALGLPVDIVLTDAEWTIIGGAWRDGGRIQLGANLARDAWRTARGARTHGYLVEPSVDALVGEALLRSPVGWRALALRPLAEAYAPVHQLQRSWALVFGIVLLGATLVASFWAGGLLAPLRHLTLATRQIGRAEFEFGPIPVRSNDEIGELTESFNGMAARLHQAQEELLHAAKFAFAGEMAAGIAHEVRTPLSVLRTSAQVILRSLPAEQHKQRELAEMMIDEVDRLEKVVAGLLELSRPQPSRLEESELAEILGRVVAFVAAEAQARGIHLHTVFAPDLPLVRCDRDQIHQVALNLVMNALQAVPSGGTITLRTRRLDHGVGFEVEDDGPGMPPDVCAKVFSPFFTTRRDGSGLGLALVERMVRGHRGSVTVQSDPGRATVFRVTLPAHPRTLDPTDLRGTP